MVKIKWTRQAIEDIHGIREYIRLHSENYAEQLTDKFFEKSELLEKYPQLGRIVPEINNKEIRELIFTNYRIIYRLISKKQIDILAVHNGLRPLSSESIFG